jgi:SAM-dependent methyltransferase
MQCTIRGVEREDWNRRHAELAERHPPGPNQTVIDEVTRLRPGRALELGCGRGRHTIWLAERGWQVTAVDFADRALEVAKEHARDLEVDWVEADLRQYEPERAAFDLVLYAFVQLPEHERRAVLTRAAEAVGPGGTLLAVIHDVRNLTEGEGGPQDASVLATPQEIAAELPGLTVERAESVKPADQVDCVVRARRS